MGIHLNLTVYLLLCASGLISFPRAASQCPCDVSYRVTFNPVWTRTSHPKDYPPGAHWSGLVGGSHSNGYTMWQRGGLSSRGVQVVAEFGGQGVLKREMDQAGDNVYDTITLSGIGSGTGSASGDLRMDSTHPLVSLVSMIAPSPDWFVGVHDLNLCNGSTWIESHMQDLFPYDAGTDSGLTFTATNQKSIPQERIHRLTGTNPNNRQSSFYGYDTVPVMAVLKFTITSQTCPPTSPPTSPSLDPVQTSPPGGCKSPISYIVKLEGSWTNMTHPKHFPSSAQFGRLTGGSHSTGYSVWSPGGMATRGMEKLAERGKHKRLMRTMTASSSVLQVISLKAISSTGKGKRVVNLDATHPLVSLVAKIAPSPDWFVGVSGLNMCDNTTGWINSLSVDLFPYDAGTDSGLQFESMNADSIPQEPIYQITGMHPMNPGGSFFGYNPMLKLGTLKFKKK